LIAAEQSTAVPTAVAAGAGWPVGHRLADALLAALRRR
jgi:hypothetical protein